MANKRRSQPQDLFAQVDQSACDKLLQSVDFPLSVISQKQDFPGCSKAAAQDDGPVYEYTDQEIRKLLKASLTTVRERDQAPKGALASLHGEIYSFAGEIVEQAKKLVDAATSDDYEGPSAKLVQAVVDGGIEALPDTLAPFGDFGIYAWCSRLQVVVKQRPKVDLSSPRVDLNGVKVHIDATGELWAKYPWWNCYRWCTKWEKVHKCKRIASVSPALEIAAEAHATAEANGPRVYVRGAFDKLRLDYPILEKIPLEGLANRALGGKRVLAYDASQLITTVPVLQSRFAVETLSLPTSADSIGIGVTIRKI